MANKSLMAFSEMAAMRRDMVSPVSLYVRLRYAVLTTLLLVAILAVSAGLAGKPLGLAKQGSGAASPAGVDAKR